MGLALCSPVHVFAHLHSVTELHSLDHLGEGREAAHPLLRSAAMPRLKIMASIPSRVRQPLVRSTRWRTMAKLDSMGLVVRRWGRKVVESKQLGAVLGQTLDRLGIFCAEGGDELIKSTFGIGPGLGHPDLVQSDLGRGLQRAAGN